MKIKVNMSKSLLESITKEVLSVMKDKKAMHKKEDYIQDPRKAMEKLQDMGDQVARNR